MKELVAMLDNHSITADCKVIVDSPSLNFITINYLVETSKTRKNNTKEVL